MNDLTPEERHAVNKLQKLADSWPSSLMLVSWAGTLTVIPVRDWTQDGAYTESAVVVRGIRNDGGDPNDLGARP